jgi:hypothetical protein
MITILTTPKPSIGNMHRDFVNAMRNWTRLCPRPEILVFGGDKKLVEAEGGRYIATYPSNKHGLPFLDGIYQIAQEEAKYDTFMLVSDHLMFMPGLMAAVQRCEATFSKFLAVGQRHDVDIAELIDYTDPHWPSALQEYITAGRLHGPSAKDYMIFSRDFPIHIPPFLVGRPWYDSWFVVATLKANIPVVDLSCTVIAAHPNHNYAQIPGNPQFNHGNPGEEYNRRLATGVTGLGLVTSSQWIDTPNGIIERGQ